MNNNIFNMFNLHEDLYVELENTKTNETKETIYLAKPKLKRIDDYMLRPLI